MTSITGSRTVIVPRKPDADEPDYPRSTSDFGAAAEFIEREIVRPT